jgi:predicted metal-binding protein
MNYSVYIDEALKMGAKSAVSFNIKDIVFDSRTLLKCMFGCDDWGKNHTCPSRAGSLKPWEYREIFEKYKGGIIIHANDKKTTQNISFAIERQAFIDGYYFAFSMSDCALCKECAGFKEKPCVNPKKARPAFHSIGIDVFATVRKMDLPIETLSNDKQVENWYAAVFIE